MHLIINLSNITQLSIKHFIECSTSIYIKLIYINNLCYKKVIFSIYASINYNMFNTGRIFFNFIYFQQFNIPAVSLRDYPLNRPCFH